MPRISYPKSFRGLAGEQSQAADLVDDLREVESTANNLDWENFDGSSLSKEHFRQFPADTPSKLILHAAVNSDIAPGLPSYGVGNSGTWVNILARPIGPFADSSILGLYQSRVFITASLTASPRLLHSVVPNKPDQVHKIRLSIDGTTASGEWHLGPDNSGMHGGLVYAFTPTQTWHQADLEFMAEWAGNTAGTPGDTAGTITIHAASLTAVAVLK